MVYGSPKSYKICFNSPNINFDWFGSVIIHLSPDLSNCRELSAYHQDKQA